MWQIYVWALSVIHSHFMHAKLVKICWARELVPFMVWQGRRSSTNLVSFIVSEMPIFLHNIKSNVFDQYNLIQLADDTIIFAEFFETLWEKFVAMFTYSDAKFQTYFAQRMMMMMQKLPNYNSNACKRRHIHLEYWWLGGCSFIWGCLSYLQMISVKFSYSTSIIEWSMRQNSPIQHQ